MSKQTELKKKMLKDSKWHAYHTTMAQFISTIAETAKQLARTTCFELNFFFFFFKEVVIN
jgi:hypothetical protein